MLYRQQCVLPLQRSVSPESLPWRPPQDKRTASRSNHKPMSKKQPCPHARTGMPCWLQVLPPHRGTLRRRLWANPKTLNTSMPQKGPPRPPPQASLLRRRTRSVYLDGRGRPQTSQLAADMSWLAKVHVAHCQHLHTRETASGNPVCWPINQLSTSNAFRFSYLTSSQCQV